MESISRNRSKIVLLLGLWSAALFAVDEEMYVQTRHADVHDAAQMTARIVRPLMRGTKVLVLKKEANWYQIREGKTQGWVPKLFLGPLPPMGEADLSKDIPQTLEVSARRRPSSYNVSAATRGFNPEDRVRQGRELYRSDYESLEAIEKIEVNPTRVREFAAAARLISE